MAPAPRVKVTDPGELADMQRKKRKEFEDNIRKNRSKMTNWTKYAAWEEAQKEYARSRYGSLQDKPSHLLCGGTALIWTPSGQKKCPDFRGCNVLYTCMYMYGKYIQVYFRI